jgi:tetratricopeptide (TPR) repeat protein
MFKGWKGDFPWTTLIWSLIAVVSLIWWGFAAQHTRARLVLIVGLSLASFMVGCAVGFLFTSYGEETSTVGRIRDWLIGGLTGLTIARAGAVKSLLLTFAAGPGPNDFALTVSLSVTYAVLGFFFMFFQRELILNVLLAQSRAERGRLEGAMKAGQVTQSLLQALPASILSGVDEVDETLDQKEAEELRRNLFSPDVQKFLDEADYVAKSGSAVDWDITSKAANLHYYRTYFQKDAEKSAQIERAYAWIQRALTINPQHLDFQVKYADLFGMMDRNTEAAAILERIEITPEAPAYLKQWLGYYLLFVPGRVDDAIRYSETYHAQFPEESDSFFNIAHGYCKKYCDELRASAKSQDPESHNRQLALKNLKEGLRFQPAFAASVRRKWLARDCSCVAQDGEFNALLREYEQPPRVTSSGDTNRSKESGG